MSNVMCTNTYEGEILYFAQKNNGFGRGRMGTADGSYVGLQAWRAHGVICIGVCRMPGAPMGAPAPVIVLQAHIHMYS